jgi:tetratricopeptide (TPR) repeat protein
VELARRLGDPATLGWALTARFIILWGPDHLDEMLALADEIVAVSEQAGAWEDLADGLAVRYETQLTRGEVSPARRDLERHTRLAEELKLPSHSWHAATHQAELMLLTGRFTDAAAYIDQALQHGMSAHPAQAMQTAVFQRFLLFLEQGGPEKARPSLERLEADRPDEKIYTSLLARLDCEQGQEPQAQARLETLARDNFGTVQRDPQWLPVMALLAEVAAIVGNTEQVRTLYELLRPYSHTRRRRRAHPLRIHVAVPRPPRSCALPARRSSPIPSACSGPERPNWGQAPGARTRRPILLGFCWLGMRTETARQLVIFFRRRWRPTRSSE